MEEGDCMIRKPKFLVTYQKNEFCTKKTMGFNTQDAVDAFIKSLHIHGIWTIEISERIDSSGATE